MTKNIIIENAIDENDPIQNLVSILITEKSKKYSFNIKRGKDEILDFKCSLYEYAKGIDKQTKEEIFFAWWDEFNAQIIWKTTNLNSINKIKNEIFSIKKGPN